MREFTLIVGGTPVRCLVARENDGFVVRVGDVTHHLRVVELEPGTLHLISEGRSRVVRIAHDQGRSFLHVDGYTLEYAGASGRTPDSPRRTSTHGELAAPMPGTITQVFVGDGDEVARGQPLVIVEAMKMEHVVRAPRAGRVRAVSARPGDKVDGGAVLVVLAGGPDEPAQ